MKLVFAIAVGMATAYFVDGYYNYGVYTRTAMEIVRQIVIHFSM
jgi:hypothetical protein